MPVVLDHTNNACYKFLKSCGDNKWKYSTKDFLNNPSSKQNMYDRFDWFDTDRSGVLTHKKVRKCIIFSTFETGNHFYLFYFRFITIPPFKYSSIQVSASGRSFQAATRRSFPSSSPSHPVFHTDHQRTLCSTE